MTPVTVTTNKRGRQSKKRVYINMFRAKESAQRVCISPPHTHTHQRKEMHVFTNNREVNVYLL